MRANVEGLQVRIAAPYSMSRSLTAVEVSTVCTDWVVLLNCKRSVIEVIEVEISIDGLASARIWAAQKVK